MTITASSFAAGIGVGLNNTKFATEVDLLARKHLLIGSFDPSMTADIADNVPIRVTSPDDVAAKTGRGFPLHRMAIGAERGSFFDVETWVLPQPESATGVAALGGVTFGGGPATSSGKVVVYIGGEKVSVNVAVADTAASIGTAFKNAVNANEDLPVLASGTSPVIVLTAKAKGTWGNWISITLGWDDEVLPGAITATVVAMGSVTAGANDPDIDDALDALGTGDNANADYFTDVNVGYGLDDDDVLDAISTYVGVGNEESGLYARTVQRPFRSLYGDTTPSAAGLTALVAITDDHTYNRAGGVIAAPGSPMHPCEIACQVMGVMARLNSIRAEETACGQVLSGVIPGLRSEQWTTEYDNMAYAVIHGVGTTKEEGGVLVIQDALTFYRPASVATKNNGYRSQRNISILQNIGANIKANWATDKWKGCSIVADVAQVGNAVSRAKARDKSMVLDDMLALTSGFGDRAWIYDKAWTSDRIKDGSTITVRSGGKGFDTTLPIILSGEGTIFNNTVEFDTSITVTL